MAIAQGTQLMQLRPLTPAEVGHHALGYVRLPHQNTIHTHTRARVH